MAIRCGVPILWPTHPWRAAVGFWPALLAQLLLAGVAPLPGGIALAQPASPNQPESIHSDPALSPPPCPLIVPKELPALQPLRIDPSQVARKNRRGCLSPADAIYGPDGCPAKLCREGGAFALPPAGPGGY